MGQILADGSGTVQRRVATSALPPGVLSGVFRRVARAAGPVRQRERRLAESYPVRAPSNLLGCLNRGEFAAAQPPAEPRDLNSFINLFARIDLDPARLALFGRIQTLVRPQAPSTMLLLYAALLSPLDPSGKRSGVLDTFADGVLPVAKEKAGVSPTLPSKKPAREVPEWLGMSASVVWSRGVAAGRIVIFEGRYRARGKRKRALPAARKSKDLATRQLPVGPLRFPGIVRTCAEAAPVLTPPPGAVDPARTLATLDALRIPVAFAPTRAPSGGPVPDGVMAPGIEASIPTTLGGPDAASRGPAAGGGGAEFAYALRRLFQALGVVPTLPMAPAELDLSALAAGIADALDPRTTIPAAVHARLSLSPEVPWAATDPLEPIMAAPDFPQPMYEPLRDLGGAWLLPGLDAVPTNTVTAVAANQRFVESYMVGLNHQMARTLLWNGYPTDQRGSYFRQFWNPAGVAAPDGTLPSPELQKDIAPIHLWSPGPLGSHRPDGSPDQVVLLIRGDLLVRYPQTAVYLIRTSDENRLIPPAPPRTDPLYREIHPAFRGTLPPDVAFYLFDVSMEEVRTTTSGHWIFILQEQSTEPRFGLAIAPPTGTALPPATWSDLAWSSLAHVDCISLTDPAVLAVTDPLEGRRKFPASEDTGSGHPALHWNQPVEGDRSSPRRITTVSSHIAMITLRSPVRLAFRALDLLTPRAGS